MIDVPDASNEKIRLFVCYSRFEFALKEAGFLSRGKRGIARADWPRFAREDYLKDVMQVGIANPDVKAMVAEPPKTQVTEDGKTCHWELRMPKQISSLLEFFVAVKSVRDNLFHGAKHGEDPRDDSLCRAAWTVLALCLERHEGVRNAFEGKY